MANIRGASQITDTEFLAAYNDSTMGTAAVLELLETDWSAIGVKLRSTRVKLHTTVVRVGGAKGTVTPIPENELSLEAQLWKKTGEVQPQPNGPYVTLEERGGIDNTNPPVPPKADPSKASVSNDIVNDKPATVTDKPAAKQDAFAFKAMLFSQDYQFSGPTKADAMHALMLKLQELNFSKVTITNSSGSTVGINDIVNGGNYRFSKQMTAA